MLQFENVHIGDYVVLSENIISLDAGSKGRVVGVDLDRMLALVQFDTGQLAKVSLGAIRKAPSWVEELQKRAIFLENALKQSIEWCGNDMFNPESDKKDADNYPELAAYLRMEAGDASS